MKGLSHVFQSSGFGGNEGKVLNGSLLYSMRALRIRKKNDTLDCIKIKKVYLSKDIKTVKKTSHRMGKAICSIYIQPKTCI